MRDTSDSKHAPTGTWQLRESLTSARPILAILIVASHVAGALFPYDPQIRSNLPLATLALIDGLLRFPTPLFAAIAGYFFVAGFDGTRQWFIAKLFRRLRSLAVPYVAWNLLFWCALALIAAYAGSIGMSALAERVSWARAAPLRQVFGIWQVPINYPLYFVRNLILYVALAPLYLSVLRRHPGMFLALAAFAAVTVDDGIRFLEYFFYFCGGAALRLRGAVPRLNRRWILFAAAGVLITAFARGSIASSAEPARWMVVGATMLGSFALAAVIVAARIPPSAATWLGANSHLAFFVYCSHALVITIARGLMPIDSSRYAGWQSTLLVLPVGIAVTAILSLFGSVMKARMPAIYDLLVGRRGEPATRPSGSERSPAITRSRGGAAPGSRVERSTERRENVVA